MGMLILMRRVGEKIVCTAEETIPKGETIEIMVTKIQDRQVCFGIDAPEMISIVRPETLNQKKEG